MCEFCDGVPCVWASARRASTHTHKQLRHRTSTYYYYFIGIFSMGDRANAIHTITTCGYFVIRIYPFHLLCATRTNEPHSLTHQPLCPFSYEQTKTKHAKCSNTFMHHMCGTMNGLSDYPRSLVNLSLFEL